MKLTCDDCGSVQAGSNPVCELCGGSLHEERSRADLGDSLKLFGASIVATGILCVLPGLLIHALWLHELTTQTFWLGYLVLWAIGSVAVRFYMPKDSYDFGWTSGGYMVDNPFTLRDNADRAHAKLGLVLFPIGLVSGLWIATFQKLIGR